MSRRRRRSIKMTKEASKMQQAPVVEKMTSSAEEETTSFVQADDKTRDSFLYNFKHRRRRRRLVSGMSFFVAIFIIKMVVVSSQDSLEDSQAAPLVYMHDSGSGDGYPRPVQPFRDSPLSSSSSMSPSLIAAKCWNNYENDNDCKQLNVITGPASSPAADSSSPDDSLITPVVIFESSSSYELPLQPPGSASPTSVQRPGEQDSQQTVLARHRTPPALRPSDDELLVTSTSSWYQSRPTATSSNDRDTYSRPTQPTTSVYVATPQPTSGQKHKTTTTEGRRCRDENDDDCDEPETSQDKDSEDSAGGGGDGGDNSTVKTLDPAPKIDESGSGESPPGDDDDDDDNEDTDDPSDDGTEEGGESSGNDSAVSPDADTPRFIEVGPTTTLSNVIATSDETTSTSATTPTTTTTTQGAQIEVVVHPTLPPSFPTTTTTTTTTTTSTTEEAAPSTIMPDDTFKSKPVFPSSSESPPGSTPDRDSEATDQSTSSEPPIDLATFKPIPMMPQVEQPTTAASRNVSLDGNQQQQQLQDKYKFVAEPVGAQTQAPAFKFDNAWRAQPVRPPAFQSSSSDNSWQQQQQQIRQRAKFGNNPNDLAAGGAANVPPQMSSRSRPEPGEMLPTLLLYASICILLVLALIFVIMAAAIWRQKNARQRALLLKSQLANQLVPSMSHASQLMMGNNNNNSNNTGGGGQQPQPGLLTTYGPGRGMQLQNKITTSLVRADSADLQADELASVGSNGKQPALVEQAASNSDSNQNVVQQQQQQQSWSQTSEDQTTTSATTSSTGSQDQRAESQQTVQQRPQKYNRQQQQQQQFNNSLSDGRQNSSSISDSQESPDGQQQQSYANDRQPPMSYEQQSYQPAQQMLYNQPPPTSLHGTTPIKRPQPPPLIQDQLGPSQSEESFVQQRVNMMPQPQAQRNYPPAAPPNGGFAFQQPAPLRGPPIYPPESRNNGYGPQPPPQQQQHQQQLPIGRFPSNGNQPPVFQAQPNGNGQHVSTTDSYAPFDGPPINQARIAMNPLATMSRRSPGANYPALNRNIYSEDSSSLMTASPSLARTSSSSSFAFNNQHHMSLDRAIEAKSMIDPSTGRLFNDYSQATKMPLPPPVNGSSIGPPPIVGRKNPGEAWYV